VAAFASRFPEMGVGETAATAIALVMHELATNSMKYGCLSEESGTLDIAGTTNDSQLVLVWTERGGPAVDRAGRPDGYGSKLLERIVGGQLGGTITYDWTEEGVVVQLELDATELAK
jgi:two-component sensor histidine kinase